MLEKERVFEFLASLNKELDEVHRCVLGKEPPPSTREVFSEVYREQSRRTMMIDKTTNLFLVFLLWKVCQLKLEQQLSAKGRSLTKKEDGVISTS